MCFQNILTKLHDQNATRYWTLEQKENQLNVIKQRVNRSDILVNLTWRRFMAKTDLSSKEQTWFSCFVSLLFFFFSLKGEKTFAIWNLWNCFKICLIWKYISFPISKVNFVDLVLFFVIKPLLLILLIYCFNTTTPYLICETNLHA